MPVIYTVRLNEDLIPKLQEFVPMNEAGTDLDIFRFVHKLKAVA
jgi:hypothetical protein